MIPPFFYRLQNLLDEAQVTSVVSWSHKGDSVLIFNEREFETTFLPWLLGTRNYASFLRLLNIYGFYRKSKPLPSGQMHDKSTEFSSDYGHPYFRQGRPDLLWLVERPSLARKMEQNGSQGQNVKPFDRASLNAHKTCGSGPQSIFLWPFANYETTLQEVLPIYRMIATQTLMWILYAIRPLHTSELLPALRTQVSSTIIAADFSSPTSLLDGPLESTIFSYLHGLIEIDDDGLIQFTHQSVREFLLAGVSRHQWVRKCKDVQLAHELLTQVSVQHLVGIDGMEISLASLSGDWSSGVAQAHHCPFCGYASVYWIEHYREAEPRSIYLPGFVHSSLLNVPLLKRKSSESDSSLLDYLLSLCASAGLTKLARVYLDMGVNSDGSILAEGWSPLDLATVHGHVAIVRMLLEEGFSVDQRCRSHGQTPLMIAVLCGNVEITQDLLQYGASVDARNSLGETPLHLAVIGGNAKCVETLLYAGAQTVAKVPLTNETPLHLATQMGYTSICQLLLGGTRNDITIRNGEIGADNCPIFRKSDGHSPLQENRAGTTADIHSSAKLPKNAEDYDYRPYSKDSKADGKLHQIKGQENKSIKYPPVATNPDDFSTKPTERDSALSVCSSKSSRDRS